LGYKIQGHQTNLVKKKNVSTRWRGVDDDVDDDASGGGAVPASTKAKLKPPPISDPENYRWLLRHECSQLKKCGNNLFVAGCGRF
jgi:hypothetical protein